MACNICNWHMSSKFSSEVLETFAGSVVTKRTENEKGNHCKNILSGSLNDSLKFNLCTTLRPFLKYIYIIMYPMSFPC